MRKRILAILAAVAASMLLLAPSAHASGWKQMTTNFSWIETVTYFTTWGSSFCFTDVEATNWSGVTADIAIEARIDSPTNQRIAWTNWHTFAHGDGAVWSGWNDVVSQSNDPYYKIVIKNHSTGVQIGPAIYHTPGVSPPDLSSGTTC